MEEAPTNTVPFSICAEADPTMRQAMRINTYFFIFDWVSYFMGKRIHKHEVADTNNVNLR